MRTRNDNTQNSSYGPGGDGAQIAYAIVDSALGRLLVAGTDRGICFAAMGEADATLVAELRSDYPRASIRVFDPNRHEDSRIGRWADALADYHRRPLEDARAANGYPWHLVPVRRMGSTARDSGRRNALVFRNRATHRAPARHPRRRHRQRRKSNLDYHPMSSRNPRIRSSRRLSLGPGTQAQAVTDGTKRSLTWIGTGYSGHALNRRCPSREDFV